MAYFPAFLELAGRRCLVVGGAAVAGGRAAGGRRPGLAGGGREELEGYLTIEYVTLAESAAEARRELRAAGRVADAAAWRRALAPDVRRLIVEHGREAAKRHVLERLGVIACA